MEIKERLKDTVQLRESNDESFITHVQYLIEF